MPVLRPQQRPGLSTQHILPTWKQARAALRIGAVDAASKVLVLSVCTNQTAVQDKDPPESETCVCRAPSPCSQDQ